ncbi:MAG: hydantoinase/oxoprolinase family protein [Thermodesulfobacteria bacterium]|nr:hydantoinase/oxoprolinase family protein [Thermodesulfobacteriota bacterium]
MLKVAVDTGGTFTDIIYLENGVLKARKVFSTPKAPFQAVLNGIEGLSPQVLIHGTTVGTNAFLERKGAKTAFLTTKGFEDIIFIGRQNRPKLYDFFVEKPAPIVSPENCFGIKERYFLKSKNYISVSEEELLKIAEVLKERKVESIGICFLHSYTFEENEKKAKSVLEKFGFEVSISCEIIPEFREYERASTTLINAYLVPVMSTYIKKLKKELKDCRLYVQQSNGGWLNAEEAGKLACHTILSGPAGGVAGALVWAKKLGISKILTFDMGGTSTDVCLIDGRLPFTKEYVIDGYPLSIPVIDIHTVGAGGGSIAYIDKGGALKVGPQSAGADPGPACYGKGKDPTVTDANLTLGRLLPDAFLGGRFKLDEEKAKKSIYELAKNLGLSIEETALGIINIANVNMTRALRRVSLERGYDPQEFALFCFGGAGGLHACSLAKELGIRKIIFPKLAGGFSAFGLLVAPPIKDFSRTVWLNAKEKDEVLKKVKELKIHAEDYLNSLKLNSKDFFYEVFLDMRYKGQGFELTIPFEEDFISAFHREHEREFGYTCKDFPVEVITVRLRLRGKSEVSEWKVEKDNDRVFRKEVKVFTEQGWIMVPVIHWDELKIGEKFKGPALIVENFTTVWIEPEFLVEVKENYTMVATYESS